MTGGWLDADRGALAVERILDAAGTEFAARGVRATTMRDIARAAGCSRATLYNHFADRRALDIAFVHREAIALAAGIAADTAEITDPHERAAAGIRAALLAVRDDPRLAVWFSEADVGVATAISADSEVLDALASAVSDHPVADADRTRVVHQRARWVIRSIVSLLSMPAGSDDDERMIIEHFVVPPLLAPEALTQRTS